MPDHAPPLFCALWKVVELRAGVDPLTGEVRPDPASLGVSPSDEAALEWALRCAERYGGSVRLVAAGGPEIATVLQLGRAAGAAEVIRVVVAGTEPGVGTGLGAPPSEAVAAAIAPFVADANLVWCGDMSPDRGSGAVPGYLAAELGIAQALGLVQVDFVDWPADEGGTADGPVAPAPRLEVLRRLDGGRRQRLLVTGRAVLSCEGGTARLRRASLPALLAAPEAPIAVGTAAGREREGSPADGTADGTAGAADPPVRVVSVGPFRPRTQVVPPPAGESALDRIRSLTRVGDSARTARSVTASPDEAADLILGTLASWGAAPTDAESR